MDEREIAASELGTEEYWNEFYNVEINNYKDTADQGEIWFGKGFLNKIIKWIECKLKLNELNSDKSILDIGCGNGKFLFELAELNFKILRGIDYSPNSIKLSNLILERDYPKCTSRIKFRQLNILAPIEQQLNDHFNWKDFDLVFDKGTYDAISLNQSHTLEELKLKYRLFIKSMLASNGLFILCSCNWSYEELRKDFIDTNTTLKLELVDEIKQSSIVFGGKAGNTVTCLIFRRDVENSV